MNNLKYYEDSLAYDFNMFAPAQKAETPKKGKIIDIPEAQKKRALRRKKAASGISGKVSVIVITAFILAMLGGNVLPRAQITETEQEIAKMGDNYTKEDILKILEDLCAKLEITLTEENKQDILALMDKLSKIDIDEEALKEQAKEIYGKVKDYVIKLKTDDDVFLDYLRKNTNFSNDYEVLVALCEQNMDFARSEYFRRRREFIIKSYVFFMIYNGKPLIMFILLYLNS